MSSERYIRRVVNPITPEPAADMPPLPATVEPEWLGTAPELASVMLAQAGSDGSLSLSSADSKVLRVVQHDCESMASFARRVARGVKLLGRKHEALERLAIVVLDYFPAGSSERSDMIASIVLRLGSSPVPLTVRFLGATEAGHG
jgi:hypothetical protein